MDKEKVITYYVKYSAIFDGFKKYDCSVIAKLVNVIKGCSEVRVDNMYGWSNMPEVVLFDCSDSKVVNNVVDILQKHFSTPWIIVCEVDWGSWWKVSEPKFKIVCIDETAGWKDGIAKNAKKILSYFIVDTANKSEKEYILRFMYHQFESTDYWYNDSMNESDYCIGQDTVTELERLWEESEDGCRYEADISCYSEVSDIEITSWYEKDPDFKDYEDLVMHLVDYYLGNPVWFY